MADDEYSLAKESVKIGGSSYQLNQKIFRCGIKDGISGKVLITVNDFIPEGKRIYVRDDEGSGIGWAIVESGSSAIIFLNQMIIVTTKIVITKGNLQSSIVQAQVIEE